MCRSTFSAKATTSTRDGRRTVCRRADIEPQVLLEGGQLDELHLWVFPFIAGSGEALLPGIMTTHLDLAGVTDLGKGCVVLTYTPKR
jgi:hypothetical protein